jgi:hypothetical protein
MSVLGSCSIAVSVSYVDISPAKPGRDRGALRLCTENATGTWRSITGGEVSGPEWSCTCGRTGFSIDVGHRADVGMPILERA